MTQLGQDKWVFIDWQGIFAGYGADQQGRDLPHGFLMPRGVELRSHQPRIEPEPVLSAEHPWEPVGIHPFSTFLEDQGRFRCWYHLPQPADHDMHLGYAESTDGVHWTKPTLNLQDFHGSKTNNLVGLESWGGVEQTHHVFIDPTAPADERYKLVSSCEDRDPFALYGATSPDGLAWKRRETPILRNRCDTHSIGAYDEELGQYLVYTRQRDNSHGRRGINRAASADFWNFPQSQPIFESFPSDPPDWDFYTNGYSRWPGAVEAHLMRFAIYHRATDSIDVHLATSRDGIRWHRPMGQQPWISSGPDACTYASAGILPTAPGEWSTYIGAYPQGHNTRGPRKPAKILRAVSREDGFTSLSATGQGECWTIPFDLTSDTIRLNARTTAKGWIRVGVQASQPSEPDTVRLPGNPVPYFQGFTPEDCSPISGDHIAISLTWQEELTTLKGKEIQLHLQLFNADLHAIHF